MQQFNKANTDQNLLNCMYGYYVKYDRLAQLINHHFAGSNASIIDIYIDMYNVAGRVFNYMKTPGVSPCNNQLFITAGIINMIAHYREFFRRYYKTQSRFWIVDGSDVSLHNKINPDFKHATQLTDSDKAIYLHNVEILSTLCPYLPDITMISSKGIDFDIQVAYIVEVEHQTLSNNNPILVISKDPFSYLIPTVIPDAYVLNPRKNKDGDQSFIVHHNCVGDYFHAINPSIPSTKTFLNEFMSFILACTRVPSRCIKNKCRLDSVLAGCSRVTNKYIPAAINFDTIYREAQIHIDNTECKMRWDSIDITHMLMAFKFTPAALLYKGIVNLYDNESVKRINETYFRDLPLDLEVL